MTRAIDKREYSLTYRQLEAVLKRHGYELEIPTANRIDIIQVRTVRGGLFGNKLKTLRTRILQIGFRDWGTEVPAVGIREIRRATGLTHENGCDSQVFFHGLDPMESLIAKYSAPLRRLARR